jgi:hypothetical protein
MHLIRRAGIPVLLAGALGSAACAPKVDIASAVTIDLVESGWYDAGIVNSQNKLVPAARITVKNVSDQKLVQLQVNSLFRQVNASEEWGSAFVTVAGSEGLAPGQSKTVFLKSNNGYTGTGETRQEMLANSHFVDAKVEVFAKYASAQWKKMKEFDPITRQLLEK